MSENRRMSRNVLANILQMLAGAGLLFALYRFISSALGVDLLGVWSVVLATVSASRMADLGLSAGVTRFVARSRARADPKIAAQFVDTAAITLMASIGIVLLPLHWVLTHVMDHLFDAPYLQQANEILPYALFSLWLTIIGMSFLGGLDGCERMTLRAAVVVIGQAILLSLALWLVPTHGLPGLAWAQIGQGLFLLTAGRLALKKALPELNAIPHQWNRTLLREMLGYGANVQAASVFMLLTDPVTKALMAKYGGPSAAGYFEMANQVVLKARAVITSANQAVVPRLAGLMESAPDEIANFYRTNIRLLILVTLPLTATLIALSGGISHLLIGYSEPKFSSILWLLTIAWGINIFNNPAYFTNMGTGQVKWNTLSHAIMGLSNAFLAYILGEQFGANGVAFAYAISIVLASMILIYTFHRIHSISLRYVFAIEHARLGLASALLTCCAILYFNSPNIFGTYTPAMLLLAPALLMALATWYHPLIADILQAVTNSRMTK